MRKYSGFWPIGMWYPTVLICNSLMTCELNIFPYASLLATCMSSLMRCLFQPYDYFLMGLLIYLLLSFKSYCIFYITLFIRCVLCKYFLPKWLLLFLILIYISCAFSKVLNSILLKLSYSVDYQETALLFFFLSHIHSFSVLN